MVSLRSPRRQLSSEPRVAYAYYSNVAELGACQFELDTGIRGPSNSSRTSYHSWGLTPNSADPAPTRVEKGYGSQPNRISWAHEMLVGSTSFMVMVEPSELL